MVYKVYPYKQGSRSAKTLAMSLGGKVLKRIESKYRPRRGDVVINWGASAVPDLGPATILNKDVSDAQCKLATFKTLQGAGISVPEFTESKEEAARFNFPVVCRQKLRGHSGDGIVIAEKQDELVAAPLYTRYIKKQDEYRVHVLRGIAFFVQRKARKLDFEEPNWQVRNLAGGFVFTEAEIEDVPASVIVDAINSVAVLGIDFGGVDVMWNNKEQKSYVLEVNTACGLEDRTAERYKKAITDNFPNQ